MMRKIFLIITLCCLLWSCRPEGVDGEVNFTFTQIATFTGNDATTGNAIFDLYRPGSAEPVRLYAQCPVTINDEKPPLRLYIRYTNESNLFDKEGEINLLSAFYITQDDVRTKWKADYDRWDSSPVYLYALSVSGPYVDMRVGLQNSDNRRIFALVLDPATATDEVPVLVMVHSFDETPPPSFDRTYYASFSLRPLIKLRPDVRKIKVRLNNSNLPDDLFELEIPR